jgi:hypothetical protein
MRRIGNTCDLPKDSLAGTSYNAAINKCKGKAREPRTLSTDPQERACLFPFIEDGALSEPFSSSAVVILPRSVVVLRRIWRREPISDFLL